MKYVAVIAAVAIGVLIEDQFHGPGVAVAGGACYLIGKFWPDKKKA